MTLVILLIIPQDSAVTLRVKEALWGCACCLPIYGSVVTDHKVRGAQAEGLGTWMGSW